MCDNDELIVGDDPDPHLTTGIFKGLNLYIYIYIYIYCYEFAPAGVRSATQLESRPSRPPDGQFSRDPSGTTTRNQSRVGI